MLWLKLGLGVAALGLLTANALTTRRLWSSAAFERSQKIAQTALIWLLPGAFAATRFLLTEPHQEPPRDPTVGRGAFEADDVPGHGHGHGGGGGGGGHDGT
jgi:hypothetical protein